MIHRTTARRRVKAAFDAALYAYQRGSDPDTLLRAAGAVIDSKSHIAPELADMISEMTDDLDVEIATYGSAAHSVRKWFAAKVAPVARR